MENISNVLNLENNGWKTGVYPLFLGEELGLHDTMNRPYPELFKLFKLMKSLDWSEDEIKLHQDRLDFESVDKSTYDVMIKTLSWQYEADSLASRSIISLFAPFISNSDLSQLMLRWSDNECYVEGAEALTINGWVDLKDLKVGDEIYTFNTETKTLSLNPINHTVCKPYAGSIYTFTDGNKRLFQQVTENHRMLSESYYTKKCKFSSAKEVEYHGGNRFLYSGKVSFIGGEDELSVYEKLAVAYQADGSHDTKYNGRYTGFLPLVISVKKERKKNSILKLKDEFENIGGEVREYKIKQEGKVHFTFMIPQSESWLFDKSFSWIKYNKNLNWYLDFLDNVKLWDSYLPPKYGYWKYINTNKSAIEVVENIVTLCGYSFYTDWKFDESNRRIPCAQITVRNKNFQAGNAVNKTESLYNGNVYCVTVDDGAFLVRQQGKISVGGNCLHATTYSEIVRQCIKNPDEIFNEILGNKDITARSSKIAEAFSKLKILGAKYTLDKDSILQEEVRETLLKTLVSLYCLEQMEFMASFACTFALAEREVFLGVASLVQKIMIDETIHTKADEAILDILLKDKDWYAVFDKIKPELKEIVDSVYHQELSWSEYIFSEDRNIVGLNTPLLKDWVKFKTQVVYHKLGLSKPFDTVDINPLPWMDNWLNIDSYQTANQETDNNNYRLNSIVDDTDGMVFDFGFNRQNDKSIVGQLTVYTKPNCPYCIKLKDFLDERNVDYLVKDVVDNPESKDYLLDKGLKTVPQVFDSEGTYHGDCTSFIEKYA